MHLIYGLVIGVLLGLWAGPVGVVGPFVAFFKKLPMRWGLLIGYLVGLTGAVLFYQVLDDLVFGRPLGTSAQERAAWLEAHQVPEAPPVKAPQEQDWSIPIWPMAAVPGGLIALFGVVGAATILNAHSDDSEER
ncbi:MAG: hypothetical protein AAGA48_20600 [Myxococcota bacterium]